MILASCFCVLLSWFLYSGLLLLICCVCYHILSSWREPISRPCDCLLCWCFRFHLYFLTRKWFFNSFRICLVPRCCVCEPGCPILCRPWNVYLPHSHQCPDYFQRKLCRSMIRSCTIWNLWCVHMHGVTQMRVLLHTIVYKLKSRTIVHKIKDLFKR